METLNYKLDSTKSTEEKIGKGNIDLVSSDPQFVNGISDLQWYHFKMSSFYRENDQNRKIHSINQRVYIISKIYIFALPPFAKLIPKVTTKASFFTKLCCGGGQNNIQPLGSRTITSMCLSKVWHRNFRVFNILLNSIYIFYSSFLYRYQTV